MHIEVLIRDQFTPVQVDALKDLAGAVYPPGHSDDSDTVEWAQTEWRVLVWNDEGQLVSHAGVLVRDARYNHQAVRLGGVGGVLTHPNSRGQGYAGTALKRAALLLNEELAVDFSLLVCRDVLVPYYQRFGWLLFDGDVFVTQSGKRTRFTFNQAMLLAGCRSAPLDGVIDLRGLPW